MSRPSPISMMPRRLGAGLLLVTLCLAGCGQKGPLYLPDRTASPEAETTTSTDPN